MYGKMKEHLAQTLSEIREAGLYKEERLIESPQRAAINVLDCKSGTTQEVLVTDKSRRDETMMTGKCGRNININFKGTEQDLGRILPVRVISAGRTTLRGEKIPEAADHE